MTQPDSIIPNPYNPQDWNRYSYVQYNPINNVDPTGHVTQKYLFYDADVGKDTLSPYPVKIGTISTVIKEQFGIVLKDVDWSLKQGYAIFNVIQQMRTGIDEITGGFGREWIQKNFSGTVITKGGLGNSCFVTGSTIHLKNNFVEGDWMSLNGKYDTLIMHEFGHVLDNRSKAGLGDASIFGGGAGDQLMKFMNISPQYGVRAAGGVNYGNSPFTGYETRYPKEGTASYGNNSTADYFANTFAAAASGYNGAPQLAVMWMAAYIDLTK